METQINRIVGWPWRELAQEQNQCGLKPKVADLPESIGTGRSRFGRSEDGNRRARSAYGPTDQGMIIAIVIGTPFVLSWALLR